MLSGRFAQAMEAFSMPLIVLGIIALCQNVWFALYTHGFTLLVIGWLGLTVFSHRRPVRTGINDGNPQTTINGHAPIEATLGSLDRPESLNFHKFPHP